MQRLIDIFIIIVIGVGLGSLSANYMLGRANKLGAINTGPWSALPFAGGAVVDPYTRARFTADGTIPLGAAEGLSFEASTDNDGQILNTRCSYRVVGNTSATRFWTLAAYGNDGKLIAENQTTKSAIFSGDVVRLPDSSFEVELSQFPRSGNWAGLTGKKEFKLILRLYDTPITSNSGVIEPTMPAILRGECTT